ncbi:VOC family protein [Kutzneria buriramensis]|uniref:Glyoxalase-like domain-containing protein n=1 Tax=Kutzneria buriramensis TaxID=1045776 RepID=A0A3E0H3P1_9PSEU|nr:VOC family protein [Kutzneria buriramensis]REH37158.1 hypothetical protein BCF44_115162 [Kutzneria buriramensis]
MATIKDIVLDCRHPASLARFWAAALDGHSVAPYDEAELERLRAKGIDDPEDDPTVLLNGTPRIWFQQVPEAKAVKNRMHLDLNADDPERELVRLTGLGATVIERLEHWVQLADPEGNEFCLMTG